MSYSTFTESIDSMGRICLVDAVSGKRLKSNFAGVDPGSGPGGWTRGVDPGGGPGGWTRGVVTSSIVAFTVYIRVCVYS